MGMNESQLLIPTISPENASNTKLNWTSSNPEVAQIMEDGTINSFTKEGESIITASTCDGSGIIASIKIVIQDSLVSIETIKAYDEEAVGRYDLTGKAVSEDYCGIVIVRYSDGSTKKVIQK